MEAEIEASVPTVDIDAVEAEFQSKSAEREKKRAERQKRAEERRRRMAIALEEEKRIEEERKRKTEQRAREMEEEETKQREMEEEYERQKKEREALTKKLAEMKAKNTREKKNLEEEMAGLELSDSDSDDNLDYDFEVSSSSEGDADIIGIDTSIEQTPTIPLNDSSSLPLKLEEKHGSDFTSALVERDDTTTTFTEKKRTLETEVYSSDDSFVNETREPDYLDSHELNYKKSTVLDLSDLNSSLSSDEDDNNDLVDSDEEEKRYLAVKKEREQKMKEIREEREKMEIGKERKLLELESERRQTEREIFDGGRRKEKKLDLIAQRRKEEDERLKLELENTRAAREKAREERRRERQKELDEMEKMMKSQSEEDEAPLRYQTEREIHQAEAERRQAERERKRREREEREERERREEEEDRKEREAKRLAWEKDLEKRIAGKYSDDSSSDETDSDMDDEEILRYLELGETSESFHGRDRNERISNLYSTKSKYNYGDDEDMDLGRIGGRSGRKVTFAEKRIQSLLNEGDDLDLYSPSSRRRNKSRDRDETGTDRSYSSYASNRYLNDDLNSERDYGRGHERDRNLAGDRDREYRTSHDLGRYSRDDRYGRDDQYGRDDPYSGDDPYGSDDPYGRERLEKRGSRYDSEGNRYSYSSRGRERDFRSDLDRRSQELLSRSKNRGIDRISSSSSRYGSRYDSSPSYSSRYSGDNSYSSDGSYSGRYGGNNYHSSYVESFENRLRMNDSSYQRRPATDSIDTLLLHSSTSRTKDEEREARRRRIENSYKEEREYAKRVASRSRRY